MSTSQLALMGFPPYERAMLEALLRDPQRPGAGYAIVAGPAAAHAILANADDAPTVRALWAAGPEARVLLIGQSDAGTGWPCQHRPVQSAALLAALARLLDGAGQPVVQTAAYAQTQPFEHAAMTVPSFRSEFAATQPFSASAINDAADASGFATTQPFTPLNGLPPAPARAAAPALAQRAAIDEQSIEQWRASRRARQATEPAERPAPPAEPTAALQPAAQPALVLQAATFQNSSDFLLGMAGKAADELPPVQPRDEVLVIDEGDVSRRALQRHLHRHGFRADLVRGVEEALQQLALRPYRFVLLNDFTGHLDALQACRAIRQRKAAARPVLVLLSSRGGAFDKLRAKLAGCDAYLVKPLNEAELLRVLAKYESQPRREPARSGAKQA